MCQATTEQHWNLDNASLKSIKYSLNSASHMTRLNLIMARVKFPNDEISESYSEAENSKSKNYSPIARHSSFTNTRAGLCENNLVDSDSSTDDFVENTTESSLPNNTTNSNNYEDIIEKMGKMRFIKFSTTEEMTIPKSRRESNSTKTMDSLKNHFTKLTKDDALNSNYCKQGYRKDIDSVNGDDDVEDRLNLGLNNIELDNRLEDEDDNDGNLIERGPVRPHLNTIRNKPYDTLDWLLQSDNYSPHECSDGQQSETSDYETSIQQLLTDNHYRETLDSCLNQLSDSSQKSGTYNGNTNQQSMTYSTTKVPPTIVVNNPEGASLLEILARGGFQAAQVFSDGGTTSGSSPGMNSEVWPDSPASSYNVNPSRSNSRASSRAQSPGSATMMPINIAGSPTGSSQVPLNFRSHQGFSSSSSSSHSYCETPSPANYQSPLDNRSEDQLDDRFNRFISWQESNESSGTIVGNNTSELINAIDSNELQLVEEVVLKELSRKNCNLEEMQVVPNSQVLYRSFESLGSVQSPIDRESRSSVDSDQRAGSETTNESSRNMSFFSESLNFGSTGSIINEAQQSLVYPKNGDGFDLVYSENTSPVGSYRGKLSPANSYMENPSPVNSYIGKSSPASLEIDATIENILANYSKSNDDHGTNGSMNFDMDLFECAKSTCTTYNSPTIVESQQPNPVTQQSSTTTFNEFQVPGALKKPSGRHVAPWSSLNIPSTKACDKLIEVLNPKDVEKAMTSLLKKTSEEWAKPDRDGYTMLMCLAGNPDELMKKKAYLVPLVERLSTIQGALSMVNNRDEDALYLMAMNCPQMAYITGYLAATMLRKGINIGQKLYQPRGDTLIHAVAARGDSHEAVLAELLALKTIRGNAVFNVSARNYEGKTALHLAVESHDPVGRGLNSIATVQLLLENGVDLMIKETIRGNTALHSAVFMSCDPTLVKVLLAKNNEVINVRNNHGNTTLHLATMTNGVSVENQLEVCKMLIENGAKSSIANGNSRTPLEFARPDRKDSIRSMFQCRSRIHQNT